MEQIIKKDIEQAVTVIRDAICRSQHRAVKAVNRELLSLYYGIGRYVSENSRKGFWGKGAIATISDVCSKNSLGFAVSRSPASRICASSMRNGQIT